MKRNIGIRTLFNFFVNVIYFAFGYFGIIESIGWAGNVFIFWTWAMAVDILFIVGFLSYFLKNIPPNAFSDFAKDIASSNGKNTIYRKFSIATGFLFGAPLFGICIAYGWLFTAAAIFVTYSCSLILMFVCDEIAESGKHLLNEG